MTSREERAWAAGFFDGEGNTCFRLTWKGKHGHVKIEMPQVHTEVLHRFCAAVEVGKVRGPYAVKNPNARPLYWFSCANFEGVQWIVCCLWPWMGSVKRKQMADALKDYAKFRQAKESKESH